MERSYFLRTTRLGFSRWQTEDEDLALQLWGDKAVTRYICAGGVFARAEIFARLRQEIENGENHGMQYWPVFSLQTGELVGCPMGPHRVGHD